MNSYRTRTCFNKNVNSQGRHERSSKLESATEYRAWDPTPCRFRVLARGLRVLQAESMVASEAKTSLSLAMERKASSISPMTPTLRPKAQPHTSPTKSTTRLSLRPSPLNQQRKKTKRKRRRILATAIHLRRPTPAIHQRTRNLKRLRRKRRSLKRQLLISMKPPKLQGRLEELRFKALRYSFRRVSSPVWKQLHLRRLIYLNQSLRIPLSQSLTSSRLHHRPNNSHKTQTLPFRSCSPKCSHKPSLTNRHSISSGD